MNDLNEMDKCTSYFKGIYLKIGLFCLILFTEKAFSGYRLQ